MPLPDFFIAGPPKAGTTALHAALANHPQLFMSSVKEPKYYLCNDQPPANQKGPGDAHSAREWIWQRKRYLDLFEAAPEDALIGESTPFYLSDVGAQARIKVDRPDARFIVILRDPIDRAHSNWSHLWVDGLEPEADFVTACHQQVRRREAGWAPFWQYLELGRYGHQLRHLIDQFSVEQVFWLRYRELVDQPGESLARICAFLGVDTGSIKEVPTANTKDFVRPSVRTQVVQRAVRAGASVGRHLPPNLWRRASEPLLWAMRDQPVDRPVLDQRDRIELLAYFVDDIGLLNEVTSSSFDDWLAEAGRGAYSVRRA